MPIERFGKRGFAGVAGAVFAAMVAGCSPYVTYPASEAGDAAGAGDVNLLPSPRVQRLAVGRVLARDLGAGVYDGGAWVLNPAGGTRLTRARDMRRRLSETYGGGLLVGEPGYESAPVYSVTRVWVRGDSARVDVVRPASGEGVRGEYGRVTVRFRADGPSWSVSDVYEWPAGAADEPELFSWPQLGGEEAASGAGSEGEA